MTALLRPPVREYINPTMDSRRWDDFRARADDIVLAAYPKSGTTWTQRILDMLIHQSTATRPLTEMYPWLDATFLDPLDETLKRLDAQTHRRAIKSHMPFDSLPIYEGVKYVHVARDGRDACFSMHNHELGLSDTAKQGIDKAAADSGKRSTSIPRPPEDPREYYLRWIASEETAASGMGSAKLLSYFDFEMTYWRERGRPNLLLVHYADMKTDLEGELRRISTFLDIDTPDELLEDIARAADFDAMKADGAALLPGVEKRFDRGHERFLNKGKSGRWRDVLTDDDIARYDALRIDRLPEAAAAWIEKGRLGAGDPQSLPD